MLFGCKYLALFIGIKYMPGEIGIHGVHSHSDGHSGIDIANRGLRLDLINRE